MNNEMAIFNIILTAIVTALITTLFCAAMNNDIRSELKTLRAEHEAIEQNYCPTCGAYLGEDNE